MLDRQPNRLDRHFRDKLYQHAQGNALFLTELIHNMQHEGALILAEDGVWEVGAALNWNSLPPRIEGVIAQRIIRLPEELREALTLASVEGEIFHAEVVAGVQQVDRRQMVRWLSSELDRQHGLVTLLGVDQAGGQTITHYRFRHILFQKYLYQRLDVAERTYLHGAVGTALETLYHEPPEASEAIAGELASHFEEAGQWLKAYDLRSKFPVVRACQGA